MITLTLPDKGTEGWKVLVEELSADAYAAEGLQCIDFDDDGNCSEPRDCPSWPNVDEEIKTIAREKVEKWLEGLISRCS